MSEKLSADLVLQNVFKSYDHPVLQGLSLTVEPGETVAIVGPSGSGKSTLLNIAGSLEAPDAGTVRLGDLDVVALRGPALAEYRARRVGFIFQEHHLLAQLTALENSLLPSLARPCGPEAAGRAKALLERVGVAHRAHGFPAEMSGGERQRVAICRALVNEPALLLCDEPTGNLDERAGSEMIDLFLDLARERGVSVLCVTHNRAFAGRFDRCLVLDQGKLATEVVLAGKPTS